MAQHDYVIANGTGAAVRSDLNNALAAIVSQNSGATEPATTYAFQFWADTTTGLLKLRNSSNNAWVTLFQLDGEWSTLPVENGTAAAPSIYFKDSGTDTGFYSPGTDQVAISTAGTGRLFINSSGSVGIGTSSPVGGGSVNVSINGSAASEANLLVNNTKTALFYADSSSVIAGSVTSIPYVLRTANADRMYISSAGNVGIGVTSPGSWNANYNGPMAVIGSTANSACGLVLLSSTTGNSRLDFSQGTGAFEQARGSVVYNHSNDSLAFSTNNSERARIDSSGRLLVGTSSAFSAGTDSQYGKFQMIGNTFSASGHGILAIGRGEAATSITSGEAIGFIPFTDNAGNTFADISCIADANAGSGDYPGRLVFSTTADGASSPTERMRITNGGDIAIGKTSPGDASASGIGLLANGAAIFARSAGEVAYFNRITNDGGIIEFRQDNTTEGSISVSGTTVSYNGAHLSRWSQLPSGVERTEILRGSVLSNIDEMCEWGDEENEQLNRMKVSDVEGDKNVSGVFQSWDDDDDTYTNDFYCAMTGDFIIRIGAGVTVQRGDLLMSAGDGTAKPQDDDIIRSKTIAKVTSTNVSCTYDDGSYCVPCVLMAC